MLSHEQKENLRAEWRNCPSREKKEIMADFIREYGDDPGWEAWMAFLLERLNLLGCEEHVRMSQEIFCWSIFKKVKNVEIRYGQVEMGITGFTDVDLPETVVIEYKFQGIDMGKIS